MPLNKCDNRIPVCVAIALLAGVFSASPVSAQLPLQPQSALRVYRSGEVLFISVDPYNDKSSHKIHITLEVKGDRTAIVITDPEAESNRRVPMDALQRHPISLINVIASAGNDVIRNDSPISSDINGYDGDDIIFGGSHTDILKGGIGADNLYGRSGGDSLYGAESNKIFYPEDGGDHIDGGPGRDYMEGNGGPDYLMGGKGSYGDAAFGEDGNDWIWGGGGADYLRGGRDNDTVFGESGHDHLNGGEGHNFLRGGSGYDWCLNASNEGECEAKWLGG